MSPCQRSLQKLRREGWLVAVVEHFNPHVQIRQDLFGFADLLAVRGDVALLVQTTSGDHVAHRLEKIKKSSSAQLWLKSPSRKIVVHGWAKRGERGETKHWSCREVGLELDEMEAVCDMARPQKRQKPVESLELFK